MPEWQTAASSLLTTLGLRYADKVLAELMVKFPPGGHPHYFVVRSLGLLAVANGKENSVCQPRDSIDDLCPSQLLLSTLPLLTFPSAPPQYAPAI